MALFSSWFRPTPAQPYYSPYVDSRTRILGRNGAPASADPRIYANPYVPNEMGAIWYLLRIMVVVAVVFMLVTALIAVFGLHPIFRSVDDRLHAPVVVPRQVFPPPQAPPPLPPPPNTVPGT